jgi:thiamine-phosphate pyrophosphorylase
MDEKPCGLIAVLPPHVQGAWGANLAEMVKDFRPAALILKSGDPAALNKIVVAAGPPEVAVLLFDDADDAVKAGANGVYLVKPEPDLAAARALLGGLAIIGAACGRSRHAAMQAAEDGADFIAFSAIGRETLDDAAALCAWWDELSGVPVALDCGVLRPSRDVLSKAQADFLVLEDTESAGESLTFAKELGLQSQT